MRELKRLNRKFRKVRKNGNWNDFNRYQSELAKVIENYTAELLNSAEDEQR